MTVKTYPLATVLSLGTGRLLCDFGAVQEAFSDLAGFPVFTHHMGSGPLVDEVTAKVLDQHPWIAELQLPDFTQARDARAAVTTWVARVAVAHGDTLAVELGDPLLPVSPLDGLPKNAIVVQLDRESR